MIEQFKDQLITLLGGITKDEFDSYCQENKEELEEVTALFTDTKKDYDDLLRDQKQVMATNKKLAKEIERKEIQLERFLPTYSPELLEVISFYERKYPTRKIIYNGMTVKVKGKTKRVEMYATDFMTFSKSMTEWLKENNLMFTGEYTLNNVSKHAWKIYSKFTGLITYATDAHLYGVDEQWVANNLQWYIKERNKWQGDCENLAILCASLIILSGIPRELVRIVVGDTKLGGHASLSVWDWRTNGFEQWETTSYNSLVLKDDSPLFIDSVWFSFNDKNSWSTRPKLKYDKLKSK